MYNGKTFEQIESNLPANMHEVDRKIYLDNVKDYISQGNTNSGYKECILNTNFRIIEKYIYQ